MAQIQRNQAASGMMPAPGQPLGVDPITGATINDKFQAQNLLNPSPEMASTVGGYMARSGPQMIPGLPGRGGRGGGGGGSMGPRQPRRKIMNLGARNTQEFTAQNGGLSPMRDSALDAAYGEGDFSRPGAPPALPALPGGGGVTPMGMGDIAGGTAGSEVAGMFTDAFRKPTPMAKGGMMKPDKIYTVGEKGPEMVVPTGDGNMHVIPHGATKKLLSMIPGRPTPRAEGGTMELVGPMGDGTVAQRGFDMGPGRRGFATTVTGGDADLLAPAPDRMMLDPTGRYQLDMNAPGLPMQPDSISGPFAEPGLPAPDLTAQQGVISRRVEALPGRGAVSIDAEQQAMRERGAIAQAELDNLRYRQEQDRVQQDLAMRASRMPLGTPTAPATGLPGMPTMTPSTQRALQRNTERLMRSPEGAVLAMQQGQEASQAEQRMRAASTAIPIRDADGNVLGYTTGTGASLPNPQTARPRTVRRQEEVNGQWMNFFDDGTVEPVAVPGGNEATQPVMVWDSMASKVVTLPANTDVTNLPAGLTALPSKPRSTEVGGAKVDPAKPNGQTPAAPVKVTSAAEALKLQPGTVFITPDGKTKIR